jgi:hypothetical protein
VVVYCQEKNLSTLLREAPNFEKLIGSDFLAPLEARLAGSNKVINSEWRGDLKLFAKCIDGELLNSESHKFGWLQGLRK